MADVAAGREQFAIVSIAQQVGKSTTCSLYFPAWYLLTNPRKRVLLFSYEGGFAAQWGGKVRDLIERWGHLFGVYVDQSSSAKDHWDILVGKDDTATIKGGMDTAGILGPLPGKSADLLLVEDVFKSPQDATPRAITDLWERWDSTIKGRIRPTTKVVLTMTRVAYDDLPGRLIEREGRADKGGRWRVLDIPAIAKDDGQDLLGRKPGEPLWPEERPLHWWLERRDGTPEYPKLAVSPKNWRTQYQQDPAPEEGSTFLKLWFENRYDEAPAQLRDLCDLRVMALDTAFKTGVGNDYTALGVFGRYRGRAAALHVERKRLAYPDLEELVVSAHKAWKPHVTLIEDKASGQSLIQTLRREHPNITVIACKGDGATKASRADVVAPWFKTGTIILPRHMAWVEEYVAEFVSFTGDGSGYDDQVDMTYYAGEYLVPRLGSRGPSLVVL